MEPIFTIETKLEPRDYRNFLYTATFRQKPYVLCLLVGIALAGAYLVQKANDWDSLASFLGLWVFFVAVSVASLCMRVERANKQRVQTDSSGFFYNPQQLRFYADRVEIDNPAIQSSATLLYSQFYQVVESHDFFLFYLNQNQVSLVRKQDVPSHDAFRAFLTQTFPGKFRKLAGVK